MLNKMPMTIIICWIIVTVPACSLFTPKAPLPNLLDIEREEQAIYSFFIGDEPALLLEATDIGFFESSPEEMKKYIQSSISDISNETLNSFLERNAQPSQLSPNMKLGIEYILLSEAELKEISSQSNWGKVLNEKYPGYSGYKIFSRVGFNNTLDQAIIYVGQIWGPLAGNGTCYYLEKQNGEWVVMGEIMIWIS